MGSWTVELQPLLLPLVQIKNKSPASELQLQLLLWRLLLLLLFLHVAAIVELQVTCRANDTSAVAHSLRPLMWPACLIPQELARWPTDRLDSTFNTNAIRHPPFSCRLYLLWSVGANEAIRETFSLFLSFPVVFLSLECA